MARLCPHCDTQSNFSGIYNGSGWWGQEPSRFNTRIGIQECQHCGGIIVVFERVIGNPVGEWMVYPASIPKVDQSVPQRVATDFISAVNCLAIRELKAAVTMFRRSLQQIMIDKNAAGKQLWEQIDDLAAKNVINADLKDWAHEIRLWGNEGAHPSKDGLDELSPDEVQEVQDFLGQLFLYIYVMPNKLNTSRQNRNTKK